LSIQRVALASLLPLVLALTSAFGQGQVSRAFNPALSFILDGKLTDYSGEPPTVAGSLLGDEAGPLPPGVSLTETELAGSANVDDKFYAFVTVGMDLEQGETKVGLEEAWVQTLSLPKGLSVKAGKFFSDIGYHNVHHPHTWDFANAPLPYLAFLGTTYADQGMQVRWVAPTVLYVELGGELMRGDGYPAAGAASQGFGARTFFARVGGELGPANNWRAGVSYLSAKADGRESTLEPLGTTRFSGDSDVAIVDFVWKWARNGNPRDRNFIAAAEYLRRDEQTQSFTAVDFDPGGPVGYAGAQSGFYLSGTYQVRPLWRVGLRFDKLSLDHVFSGALANGADPKRVSVMSDWSPSEFSRLRLQIDDFKQGSETSTGIFFQYIMSMGSHGAHRF
jgi:hypothetical protein